MSEFNPYQAPQQDVVPRSALIDGEFVLLEKNQDLPDYCLKCGGESSRRYKETLTWISPWLLLAFLVNILVFLIFYFFTKKSTTIRYSLCTEHVRVRRIRTATLSALFFGGALLVFAAASQESAVAIVMSCSILAIWLIALVAWPRTVRIHKYKEKIFWLKGANAGFRERYVREPGH